MYEIPDKLVFNITLLIFSIYSILVQISYTLLNSFIKIFIDCW